jgi:translation initiation factor IF-2
LLKNFYKEEYQMPKKKESTKKLISIRPPIVTIMGHVDHGKTTLLDTIRKTNLAVLEHGGITQHIGAYQIEIETREGKKKITFIDTPGHEAFVKMRSHGADVTDIVVLVVAADDGVMPQTIEAIGHIKQAKVPVIVAINKIDLPDTNPDRVKKQLARNGILVEGFGGDVIAVEISAKTGKGVQELLEMVILTAEMAQLEGDSDGKLKLAVIESKLNKKLGPVATVIILNGTLKVGDMVELGGVKSKVRALINHEGKNIDKATPAVPVEIVGLERVPVMGESTTTQDVIPQEVKKDTDNKLNIILKTDVIGSLEAIKYSLPEVNILHAATGDISESDILTAKTNKAVVIGFNIKLPPHVETLAKTEKVQVKIYTLIYRLLDEVKEVIEALHNPQEQEEIIGQAKIIAKVNTSFGEIAGSQVLEGRLARGDKIRLLRQDKELAKGLIKSIHHRKEDIPKAERGIECGVLLTPALDFEVGDMIVSVREKS